MAKWKKRLAVGSKVKLKLRSVNILGVTLEGIEVQVGPLMVPLLMLVDLYVRSR